MPETKKAKYQKDAYYHTDNTRYSNKKEYQPEKTLIRIHNPKTDAFELKEIEINHKLEWENTEATLKQTLLSEESEK